MSSNDSKTIAVVCGDITAALNRRNELMQLFHSSSDRALFFCPEHETRFYDEIKELGFELTVTPNNKQSLNPFNDLSYFRTIYAELKKNRPDHVFIFHMKQILYAGLACRMLGIKYHCLFAGLGYLFSEEQSLKRKVAKGLSTRALKSALKRANTIFFQNPDDLKTFQNHGILGKGSNPVVVNGSGVALERFEYTEAKPAKPVTYLCIARILRDKGLPELYEASKRLKAKWGDDIRVQLMGPFDENPNSMKREEIDRWHDEGIIEYLGVTDDVRPFLRDASVFTLPSFYMEGTPKIILESLAIGRAIITTDSRGCRETIDDGKNGILIQPKDVDNLVEAMEAYLNDPELIRQHGEASRHLAETRYDVRKVNQQMVLEMGLVSS